MCRLRPVESRQQLETTVDKSNNEMTKQRRRLGLLSGWKRLERPRPRARVTEDRSGWKIHAPMIGTLKESLILEVRRCPLIRAEMRSSLDYLSEPNLYQQKVEVFSNLKDSTISSAAIKALVESGVIARDEEEASGVGQSRVFLVPEADKRRFRVITESVFANWATSPPPNPRFKKIHRVLKELADGSLAVTFDFKCFFFQFNLGQQVQKFFTFHNEGEPWKMLKLAMGFKHSVNIAQSVSLFLALKAMVNMRLQVKMDVYVDGVIFSGENRMLLKLVSDNFMKVCMKFDVEIGAFSDITQKVEWRGLEVDLDSKVYRLKTKWITKLLVRGNLGLEDSWGAMASVLGMIIYAQSMGKPDPVLALRTTRILARHASTDDRMIVRDPDALRTIAVAIAEVAKNPWIPLPTTFDENIPVLITDASSVGKGGAVLVLRGEKPMILTPELSTSVIAEREMEVIVKAIVAGREILQRGVTIITDNMAVAHAIARARGWNETTAEFLRIISATPIKAVHYIKSAANPADGLSRGLDWSHHDHSLLVAATTAMGWGGGAGPN